MTSNLNQLINKTFSSSLFNYDLQKKVFTTDASKLNLQYLNLDYIEIKSEKTKDIARFDFLKKERCAEGELLAVYFKHNDLTLVVFNS